MTERFWPAAPRGFYPNRQLQTYRRKPGGRWPPQQPKPKPVDDTEKPPKPAQENDE